MPMSDKVKKLFHELREEIFELDADAIELAEKKSISDHSPDFFWEVLPRKRRLQLLLPLEYNEIEEPDDNVFDATEKKFFVNSKYGGGVSAVIREEDEVEKAIPIIRQAWKLSNA